MEVLLIHSEDDPEKGPWSSLAWDRIVDLGLGGAGTYARWSKRFGCPVEPLDSLRNGFDDFRLVRDLLGRGCGQLVDDYGLDWWEIMSILLTGEVETLILLQRLVQTLNSGDQVYISRPGSHADVLRLLLGTSVHVFPARGRAAKLKPGYYLRLSAKLSKAQMVDIFWDKYDPGYQLRGRIVALRPRIPCSKQPLVLLPSAYVNVSRTGIQYANTFPEERFLLVTTRRSGWVQEPPPNVTTAWLSSYSSVRDRVNENREMQSRWECLKRELTGVPEFDVLNRLGQMASFPRRFRHGLEVRDAWRNVLDREPVQAVLCADDSNPYTRIPLLLARQRGLLNIACHHGALDGRYVFKRSHADVIWAKGRMEADYLVRMCGVPPENVELGAPALADGWSACKDSGDQASPSPPYILFFSELYEVCGGRPEEFYRDVLPQLADLALATERKLVVKLHPAESERERTRVLARILSAEQRAVTSVLCGALTEDLLAKTWCGVTILSTVAMECAVRGIPCFLCKWLEFLPHGYVEQFIRFGVGIGLGDPRELAEIPQYLREHAVQTSVRENCWQPAAPGRLRQLLTFSQKPCTGVAS